MSAFQAVLDNATSVLATELENHAQRVKDVFHGASCSLTDLPSLAHAAVDILASSQDLLTRSTREWIQDSRTRQEFITTAHPLLLRTGQQLAANVLATAQATQRPYSTEECRLDAQGRQIDALEAQLEVLSKAQQRGSPLSKTTVFAGGHHASFDLGSPIDTPPSSPVERIREAIRASAAVNSNETATPSAGQDDNLFSAPISPVVDDSNDSDYEDEVVIVENPDRSKKYWVYEDETLAEVQRYRQAMKAGLCDHRYQGLDDRHCDKPRAECIERRLGNHSDQCRWITTKHTARCKASIKQCPQHRQWAPQPPPGKLFRRELSTRPQGVDAQEFFLCAHQPFKQEFTGSDKKKPRII
ncbi:hypothetical protein Ae201684P_022347 [Aphanomyces euteiches]|uniref:Uncharacterized protein n=1 Tax=Aphanomyces euteiches TaxID=100861 RepID=A0A6G0X652_9STRA|nr:hypothetical protein Ae201684_008094 [Aphanomyces euteiches]KAH9074540.1 hypothetical protein Ae201684P_022347 [Aphanomyces euteiches]